MCVSMTTVHCLVYKTADCLCPPVGNASQRAAEPQPETQAVMNLIQERGFSLSVALDGGSVLVTYPYDKPVQSGMFWLILCFMKLHIYCICVLIRLFLLFFPPSFLITVENDDTLRYLATVYAKNHPTMHLGNTGCPNSSQRMLISFHTSSF